MRLPNPRPHLLGLVGATAALLVGTGAALAQLDYRDLVTVEQRALFRPPPLRVEAMGGLGLSVRDEYTELGLWDFAGLALELLEDRDSTSLDMWLDRDGVTLDRKRGDVTAEVSRQRAVSLAGEGVIRAGDMAVGLQAGRVGVSLGQPFDSDRHTTRAVSHPVVRPVAGGRLWRGLTWGLSGLYGKEKSVERWWLDRMQGGRVELVAAGEQLLPPGFFTPDHGEVGVSGFGGALGYRHGRWGHAGLYLEKRWDDVVREMRTTRSRYETNETQDWTGYGLAAIAKPREKLDVGLAVGRQFRSDLERYRFTLSGGSSSGAFGARGDRSLNDVRRDFVHLRALGDVPGTAVTMGGAVRVAFEHAAQSPSTAGPTNFNRFIEEVVAGDTLVAPELVRYLHRDSRRLEWGIGGSVRFLEGQRALVGAELHWRRDALVGTDLLLRKKEWEVRAGGQYEIHRRWTGLAGFRHTSGDGDTYTARNETLVDRVSAGVEGRDFWSWRLTAEVYREWHRTDYPDPGELGGAGTGFGVHLARGF